MSKSVSCIISGKMQLILFVIFTFILNGIVAPPVQKTKEQTAAENEVPADGLEEYMEYHRYLREVVGALESDPEFRKKLENASEADIRSGKIAEELEFVSHSVRTRLDEIKRTELERLRDLAEQKIQIQEGNEIDQDDDPTHHHLDRHNPHTFEVDDLKKLIAKSTADLAEADRKRREEFKQYELQKEYEKQLKLNQTTGEEHNKLEREYKEMEDKHKKHEPLHQPGHQQQLEEVWEEQDHMQQEFDPKTFFMLHDLDGNGFWDQNEVKALFIKELDKMYAAGAPEDDMRERYEEMERMRESVFSEVDADRDGVINYQEFLQQTKKREFKEDNGWKGLDEQRQFTEEEYQQYIMQHEAQLRAQMAQMQAHYPPGQMPPPGGYHPGQPPMHPGQMHHGQVPPGYYQQQGHPPPQGYHPNQVPQQHMPPQHHPQQQPQYQNVPPAQQFHPGQHGAGQVHPQQLPGQMHPNQVPPQGNPSFPAVSQSQQQHLNTNEVLPEKKQPSAQVPVQVNQQGQQQQAPAAGNVQYQQQPPASNVQQQQVPQQQQQVPQANVQQNQQQIHTNNIQQNHV